MAALTWRDVAGGGGGGGGGGRYSQGNSDQLMEGIRGFNEAIGAITNRKNNRALRDIENQMALNNLAAEHQQSQSAAMQDVVTAQDQAQGAAAEAEWNRASGSLLESAFRHGAQPGSPNPLRGDFLNLSPRAQALGSALMAEQITSGREFGSEDASRRAANEVAAANSEIARTREEREAEIYERERKASRDPFTDMDKASRERLRGFQTRAASELATYRGDEFADKDISTDKRIDTGKMYTTWGKVEDRLAAEGLFGTPLSVLNMFAARVGKDSGKNVEDALHRMALAYHRSHRLNSLATGELATAHGNPKGYQITDDRIQEMLTQAQGIGRPKVESTPASASSPPRFDPKEVLVRDW